MAMQPATFETSNATITGASEQLEMLTRRLENGWQLIERTAAQGKPVEELERHWLRLLQEYEALCPTAS